MWFAGMHVSGKAYLCNMHFSTNRLMPLSQLPAGRKAVIELHEESDFKLTLLEMGCLPGEPVQIQMIAPLGDPIAIQIAGYALSIRKKDAEKIIVALSEI
jgi:ferrous iron transport protein A